MSMRVTMRNPRRSEDGLSTLLAGTTYTVSDAYGQELVQGQHAVDTDGVIARDDAATRDNLLPAEVAATRALVSGAGVFTVNSRDGQGRATSFTDAAGVTYTVTYGNNGPSTISGGGQIRTYAYNASGLLTGYSAS